MPETEDLYEILQVHPAAQPEIIQAAYRKLAQLYHPDRNPSRDGTAKMTRINDAYEMLSDPKKRAAYDKSRKAQASSAKTEAEEPERRNRRPAWMHPDSWQYYDDGDLAEVCAQMGWQCSDSDEYVQAIEHFNTATELDPCNARAFSGRGRAYRELSVYWKAIEDLTTAIRLDPRDNVTYRERGVAYSHLGEWQNAIENLNVAVSLNPGDARALMARGLAHEKQGEFSWAIDDMNRAIEIEPDNPMHYFMRGFAWEALGLYDLANVDFETSNMMDF